MALELDLLNHLWKRSEKEQNFARYNYAVKAARPFSFDARVVEMVAEMASGPRRHKMMPIYRQMARLPFPIMWLEFDYAVLHRWRVKHGTAVDDHGPTGTVDSSRGMFGKPERIGFLIDEIENRPGDSYRVTTFGMMPSPEGVEGYDPTPKPHAFPLVHNLSTGPDKVFFRPNGWHRNQRMMDEINRMNQESIATAICWGMDNDITKEKWKESDLFGTNGVEPEPMFVEHIMQRNIDREDGMIAKMHSTLLQSAMEQKGDLRFIVAALSLLNHVPVVYKHYRPKGQLLTKSRMKPFLASSTVTLQIPVTRRFIREMDKHMKSELRHSRHRRHEVRGHWRVSDKSHGDRWQRFMDPVTMRPRWRIWIEHHERGDASLGWVRQFYNVEGRSHAA